MRRVYEKLKNSILNPILIMYVMLVVSYFSQIRFCYEYLGILRKCVLVWGAILLIYSIFENIRIYKSKYAFVLLLFCVSSCISVLVNYTSRFFYGIVTMVYVSTFLLIFFNGIRWNEEIGKKKDIIVNHVLNINVVLSFVFAVIALIMYMFNIQGEYMSGESIIYYGMRENRLWGLYNSNTAATVCIISIVSSFIQLKMNKRRGFLISNIVIQVIYLILTQSRTGWILIMIFAILYLFFNWIVPTLKSKAKIGKKMLTILCSIAIIYGIGICPSIAKPVLVKIPQAVIYMIKIINPEGSEKLNSDISLDRIDKEFLEEQDATNGRSELWLAGLEILKDNPIFGIGSENIVKEAEQYLSEARYQNLVKGGFHNSYLAILVSSGIVGFVIFGIFVFMLVVDGIKYLWENGKCKYSMIIMLLFTLMVNELMEARWLYNTSYLNIIFWIFAGFVVDEIGGAREK